MTRLGLVVALALVTGLPLTSQMPAFEVASVKPNTSDAPPSSRFPLGPGDAYVAGSLFSAANQPLINYIRFAFGRSQGELLRLPSWVYDERFDIQARATGEVTKNEMRLMMRTLLARRFSLTWHVERREESVLELVLAKPGEFGPQLRRDVTGQQCGQDVTPPPDPKFNSIPCGAGLVSSMSPGRASISGRAEPIEKLAGVLSNNSFAGVDRVVLDRTGLTGAFDFTVEWAVRSAEPQPRPFGDDVDGPPLDVALRRQLGLTLRPTRAPIDVLVIDSVQRPTPD